MLERKINGLLKKTAGVVLCIFSFGCCTLQGSSNKYSATISEMRSSVVLVEADHDVFLQYKGTAPKDNKNLAYKRASSGSGVIVEHSLDYSLVMTAAHVCEILFDSQIKGFFQSYDPAKHQIDVKTQITLVDISGQSHPAMPIVYNKSADTCVLMSPRINQRASPLASNGPQFDETYTLMGFPYGLYDKDFVPTVTGKFVGKMSRHTIDANVFSVPGAPGFSGSGVFNQRGEVVGILHSVFRMYNHLSLVATLEQTRDCLKQAKEVLQAFQTETSSAVKELEGRRLSVSSPATPFIYK